MTSRSSSNLRFALLIAFAAMIACLGLVAGSTDIGVRPAIAALFGDAAEPARTVVLELRAPRLLSAFTIGALLALAGVLLQALFRNPLADSYVLGVSGGSSVGALFALLLGASLWVVQCSAAIGAMSATFLVLALARGGATVRVLLTVGDLHPLLEDRPAERVARRWFPDYQGEIPAGAYPAGWVPSR